MSNQEKLFRAIADVLNTDIHLINEDSSADTLDGWDSLAMVNLIIELEQIFKVKFDIFELPDLQNIKIIKKTLEKKAVNFD